MIAPLTYEPRYTEQAASARDRLDDLRRAAFDRGLAALAQDPFPAVSRASDPAGTTRRVRLTKDALVEYAVSLGRLVIIDVTVFDDADVLVPDA
ncbi:hypothetical protein [Streptomyces muensis]|uniref:Uncharacterized protein n=1 Tax=Streptomyces muensis TaxID=1077944 RepID=A0A9X1Q4L3_STRM4|nr:hypothetical protein [Streptomyces muensis]MCF1598553.1 hypothetical protein [Streptomyces muensis]